VARVGARLIYWTYDPLQARNAHLNFNVLGVRATEYVEDMYGDTDSPLHRGIGTDRFIVAWAVDDVELRARQRVVAAALADEEFRHAPVVNPELDGGILTRLAPKLRVQVPGNIGALQADDLATAVRWRASSRAAIQHLLRAGYSVNGFRRDAGADRGYYLFATS
jgi:predicted GNAT superfamily acetyltransferase